MNKENTTSPFAIIFDMDGVIVDSNPAHKEALLEFFDKHGFDLTDEYIEQNIYGRTNRDWISSLFGNLTNNEWEKYEHEKEALFREIYSSDIKPVEGLLTFLDKLKKHDIPRAIATSAPYENVEFVLDKTGIRSYFDVILDESDVTVGKPDPQIYLKTVRELSLPAEQCIVIEDSLSGVKAAKRAGCKVVGITTTHKDYEFEHTDLTIDNFNDLDLDTLESLIPKHSLNK